MSDRFDSLDRHYKIIEKLNVTTSTLFWVNAVLSISVFFVDDYLNAKNMLLFVFTITTLAYFVIDNYLSIFKIPQVEDKRRVHLLTNSFNVPLDNERTNKYYNNDLDPSLLKLGANIFENSLFAERVTHEMAKRERLKVGIFIFVFVVALVLRTTEMELISILAQTLFASTLIPAYFRLEILHSKNKAIYDCLHDIFLFHYRGTNLNDERLSAKILDCFVKYESAKAYSGVKQDSKIFHKINPRVTQEWEEIKRNLNIGTNL
ncbi:MULTISPECIES: hypothetical protein [unclassified Sporosarcina]|uniref:hypothetical protein n=1 Tax=unclassified Sporosarcina TaxID=2647733 RepID=UPI000C16311C|nr:MULTISPECIES: hypothetical protein [unclassified Sporosarcina]PID07789.1 hypothetical protein CSV65_14340 [Sporosarcina sp. P31]PID11022.1 hypothetical protein CSV64_14135 [Sporosarcina sp. P32b]